MGKYKDSGIIICIICRGTGHFRDDACVACAGMGHFVTARHPHDTAHTAQTTSSKIRAKSGKFTRNNIPRGEHYRAATTTS